MKQCSMLIVALVFVASMAMAQSENALNVGAKMGANFGQISGSGNHMGGNVGAFVLFNFSDKIGLQGELLYNVIGGAKDPYTRVSADGLDELLTSITFTDRSITFHNAEIPVFVKYNLGTGDDIIKPKFFAGASYAYTAAAIERRDQIFDFATTGEIRRSGDYENVGAEFEQHQFAAVVGISLDYILASNKIFTTEIRYRRGLNDLSNYGVLQQFGDSWLNTISISFGYSFL